MPTAVEDLMSSPPVTCPADASLSEATVLMDHRQIGSVVITERDAVVGILTERDLMRATATAIDPRAESVRRWMTADPDVVGVHDRVDAAWSGLTHHHYRHLPVVDHGDLVGVVSLRDLLSVAQIRPADEAGAEVPRGVEGVVVAETAVGDVPRPAGLLPLPGVLGHRPGRRPVLRGRLAPVVRGAPPRPPDLGPPSPPRSPASGICPPGWPGSCPPWPRSAHPSTFSAPPCRCWCRARLAAGSATSTPGNAGPRPPPRCRGAHHPDRRPTGLPPRPGLPCRPGRTSPLPPTTCGCSTGPGRPRRTTCGPSSSTSSSPSTTVSTPPPSPPGSSPPPAPTWPWPSSGRWGPCRGRCTGAPRAGPSTCSTTSAHPNGPEDGSGTRWSGATASWGSVTGSTRPTTRCVFLRGVARSLGGRAGGLRREVERTTVEVLRRAQAGPAALHQRGVLRRRGHARPVASPGTMFTPTFACSRTRVGHPRHGAGRRQPPHPAGGPVCRPHLPQPVPDPECRVRWGRRAPPPPRPPCAPRPTGGAVPGARSASRDRIAGTGRGTQMYQTVSVPPGPDPTPPGAPDGSPVVTWWATHWTSPPASSPSTSKRALATRWKVRW